MREPKSQIHPPAGDLIAFNQWLEGIDRTRATGHRWRKQFPWLKTINIFGKLYIQRTTIEEFEQRAFAGEFERDIHPMAALLPQQGRPRKKTFSASALAPKINNPRSGKRRFMQSKQSKTTTSKQPSF